MSPIKDSHPDHPIHDLIAKRWSPYAFADKPVSDEDLRSLFEAARWAQSSYNEQPWRYIVATKEDPGAFQQLHSCLVEGNQPWTLTAPVLALGCVALKFARNGKPNAAAEHDLGAASAYLTMEATARGLFVHQMIGILPDRARELYKIPDDFRAHTALAIGYLGDANALPDAYKQRDLAPRQRRPQAEFVFSGQWGRAAQIGK
jgi:nitroreductase